MWLHEEYKSDVKDFAEHLRRDADLRSNSSL
jgi:hypothetical protein